MSTYRYKLIGPNNILYGKEDYLDPYECEEAAASALAHLELVRKCFPNNDWADCNGYDVYEN